MSVSFEMSRPIVTCFVYVLTLVSASKNNLNDVLFSGGYEFIDLTFPFDNNTVYWLNTQNFVFTKKLENYQQDGSW